MIQGVHALIYTSQAEAVRTFLRDVLGFPSVDAGQGWLIFALPPAELGVHPVEGHAAAEAEGGCELHLMCDDVHATMAELAAKGVEFTRPVTDAGYGLVTAIRLPGGGELGLYEPRHPTALGIGSPH